jgi:hypothetical protein
VLALNSRVVLDALVDGPEGAVTKTYVNVTLLEPVGASSSRSQASNSALATSSASEHAGSTWVHGTLAEANSEEEVRGIGRVCWVFDASYVPRWVLYSERMTTVRDLSDEEGGGVEVRTWENFTGVVGWIVKWKLGDVLNRRFEESLEGLRQYFLKKSDGRP